MYNDHKTKHDRTKRPKQKETPKALLVDIAIRFAIVALLYTVLAVVYLTVTAT